VLDDEGKPIKVIQKVRKQAHMLIEDFMLLANKYVAEYAFNLKPAPKKGKTKLAEVAAQMGKPINPMVYRVHEPPDPDKIVQLSQFVSRFGYRLAMEASNLQTALNQLSAQTENKPESVVIAQYAVRSMMKARYTLEPLGHFGLGYTHYTHFTSPIRRYPDMMVHRCLAQYLAGEVPSDTEFLAKACKQSNEMEKRAADAERASIKYKQVEFMMERIGQEFEGIVSGLTEWGMFVEIVDTACEGMIRLADIRDDHYLYDPERMTLTGRSRGKTYQFGDKLRIRVKDANLLKRTLDLELADQRANNARAQHNREPSRPGALDRAAAKSRNGGRRKRK
jgi:ribonuclease R